MAKSKAERWAKIHAESMAEFERAHAACCDERKLCIEDRRLCVIPGASWEGAWGDQFANRPKLEINKLPQAMMVAFGEYRNNRIAVDFVPKGEVKDDKLSDLCDGLLRADEQDSQAEEAYDNAFDEGLSGGFGAWRLRACYEDELDPENDHQRIRIEPIYDADTCVFWDAGAMRYDKSDARRCWVLSPYTRERFQEEFGQSPSDWPKTDTESIFDWYGPDFVYVAETYVVEEVPETRVTFQNAEGEEVHHLLSELDESEEEQTEEMAEGEDAEPSLARVLAATGWIETKRRKFKKRKVRKYLESGGGILEDCGHIAGSEIPIVPFYGRRFVVSGIERCMGIARYSRDAATLKNLQITKLAEIAAASGIEKPIFDPAQVHGHQHIWANDAVENYGYLTINMLDEQGQPLPIQGPIGYTKPPSVPPAMAALLQLTEADLNDILGANQAGEKVVSNISGKAVEMVQSRLDLKNFVPMSNMAKSMKRSGEIWLSMASEVYAEDGREVRTVGPDGKPSFKKLRMLIQSGPGVEAYENDLANAKMQVVAEVGPSTQTRRDATVRALIGVLQTTQDAETKAVLESMILMNMDGEGLDQIRSFYRAKLVRIGAIKPTEEEAAQMAAQAQNQRPDPEALFLTASAQEATAKAAKAEADALGAVAKAELTKAQTAETLSKLTIDEQNHTLNTAKALYEATAVQPGSLGPTQPSGGMQYA